MGISPVSRLIESVTRHLEGVTMRIRYLIFVLFFTGTTFAQSVVDSNLKVQT